MSIRLGLLTLLAEQPMGVYRLRKLFESRTGGAWPLNIGQVYTTVQRLERDGLVDRIEDDGEDIDRFEATDAGQAATVEWARSSVPRGGSGREELVIKLALAVSSPTSDPTAMVQAQRTETLRAMRDFARLKSALPAPGQPIGASELAWSLVLDHHTFAAEAEIRWLDHLEATLARTNIIPTEPTTPTPPTTATSPRAGHQ